MKRLLVISALAACLIPAVGLSADQPAGQPEVPGALVQYVSDARKAGLDEPQIRQNAVKAGWPADLVSGALSAAFHPVAAKPSGNEVSTAAAEAAAAKPRPAEPPPAPAAEPAKVPMEHAPAAIAPAIDRGVPGDYQIGAGDELQISVWKEPDASVPTAVVRPDGKISMPMLKDISVVGMTPTQAEQMITAQLVKFINTADVTVIVKAINSKKIYVTGGVKKEGPIAYTYRMTILEALSEAGGLSDYAKKKKIYVLRHEKGRDFQLPFDYDAALRGEKMELNVPLQPGDTIVVPK